MIVLEEALVSTKILIVKLNRKDSFLKFHELRWDKMIFDQYTQVLKMKLTI